MAVFKKESINASLLNLRLLCVYLTLKPVKTRNCKLILQLTEICGQCTPAGNKLTQKKQSEYADNDFYQTETQIML